MVTKRKKKKRDRVHGSLLFSSPSQKGRHAR